MSSKAWVAESSDEEDEPTTQEVPAPVNEPVANQSRSNVRDQPLAANSRGKFVGFVANLKFRTSVDEVGNFFSDAGCDIDDIELLTKPDGSSMGKAVVTMNDEASLRIFLDLNEQNFKGNLIMTKVWEERPPKQQQRGNRDGNLNRGPRTFNNNRDNRHFERDNRDNKEFGGSRHQSNDVRILPREHKDKEDGFNRRERLPRQDREQNQDKEQQPNATEEKEKVPVERPKLNLQPRTKPIEIIGKERVSSNIFGGGKPHDEHEYERKKHDPKETITIAAETNTANTPPPAPTDNTSTLTITPPPAEESNKPASNEKGAQRDDEFKTVHNKRGPKKDKEHREPREKDFKDKERRHPRGPRDFHKADEGQKPVAASTDAPVTVTNTPSAQVKEHRERPPRENRGPREHREHREREQGPRDAAKEKDNTSGEANKEREQSNRPPRREQRERKESETSNTANATGNKDGKPRRERGPRNNKPKDSTEENLAAEVQKVEIKEEANVEDSEFTVISSKKNKNSSNTANAGGKVLASKAIAAATTNTASTATTASTTNNSGNKAKNAYAALDSDSD